MADDLKVGDTVRLKSGGPKMTIKEMGKYGMGSTRIEAKCAWFDGTKLIEQIFEPATLDKED
jgi:uncharacterized protein YodC (DUF2158 family)